MNAKLNEFTSVADGRINIFDVLDFAGALALELVSSLLGTALGL